MVLIGIALLYARTSALNLAGRSSTHGSVRTSTRSATSSSLRAAHSGNIGDHVMWLTVGTAVIGGIRAFTLT